VSSSNAPENAPNTELLTGAASILLKSVTVKLTSIASAFQLLLNGKLDVPLVIDRLVIIPSLIFWIPLLYILQIYGDV